MGNELMTARDSQWCFARMVSALPRAAPSSVVAWAEEHFLLVGSARSETYRADITPWTREPIECANDGTRKMTFIKPIQAGGSSAGEIVIGFWLSHWSGGDIQYNWPNDEHMKARWKKHIEKKLRACVPVMRRTSADRFDWTDGLVIFPHLNLIVQGVNIDRSVTGDSIRGQVNEELHDSDNWIPGRLEQAYGRTTAYWNSVIFNISNASRKGDQLHQAFEQGTQQHWMVKCPGCKQFHVMRTKWDAERPDLGGLRYDMLDARLESGDVSYSKLAATVRYQMPCGFIVHDTPSERRELSLSGRYSDPTNRGAPLTERSYTLEAIAVDYIPWISLIRQKHLALRARKLGDPKPFLDYLRERECAFVGVEDRRPEPPQITLSSRKKDRSGLENRKFRFASVDYQTGRKEFGELPHFWCFIMDFDALGNALLVHESKAESEGELLDVLRRHEVKPICTVLDSSWVGESKYVYTLALRYGFNCLKVAGGQDRSFQHEDGVRRVWSEPEPLWPRVPGQEGPSKADPDQEPEFWVVSFSGALDSLAHMRGRTERAYEIPVDVSEEFKIHFAAWSLETYKIPATNQEALRWKKAGEKTPDHLFMCASYVAVWAEMAGIVGQDLIPEEEGAEVETSAP